MSFRLVPKSVTLNGEMALFCVILPNLVVSGAHCVKVVDKALPQKAGQKQSDRGCSEL